MSFEDKATEAYKQAHSELSAVLYEHDPLGVYGAPDDEYDMEATTLLPALKEATGPEDAEEVIRRMFDFDWKDDPRAAYADCAKDVWRVWSRFQEVLAEAR
jgi:hypothetical protein